MYVTAKDNHIDQGLREQYSLVHACESDDIRYDSASSGIQLNTSAPLESQIIHAKVEDNDVAQVLIWNWDGVVPGEEGFNDTYMVKLRTRPKGSVTVFAKHALPANGRSVQSTVSPSFLVFDHSSEQGKNNWEIVPNQTLLLMHSHKVHCN